jgi:hypothetical protein
MNGQKGRIRGSISTWGRILAARRLWDVDADHIEIIKALEGEAQFLGHSQAG